MAPVVLLPAQTAAELDGILATPAVSFTQASRFVLVLADVIDEKKDAAAAYSLAMEQGWLAGAGSADLSDKPIKQGELCFLIMNAFNMEGSFLYNLFPGPRYAFRELSYLKLIPGRKDPALPVSGEEMLRILGMVEAYLAERNRPAEAPAPRPELTAAPPPEPESLPKPKPPPLPEVAAAPVVPPAPGPDMALELAGQHPAPELRMGVVLSSVLEPEPGPPASRPEPPPKPVVEIQGPALVGTVYFGPDQWTLMEAEMTKLRKIAPVLSQYRDRKVLVGGYTALAGSLRGRRQVSTERAQTVAAFLVSQGALRAEQIIVRGYGAAQPARNNVSRAGRAMNRRVEITILGERLP